jgi:hypothetical protein
MMDSSFLAAAFECIHAQGVALEPGLSDAEIASLGERLRFQFPPDVRLLLQTKLPLHPDCPNWRSDTTERLRDWLDWPRKGICFDIEKNGIWSEEDWGKKPAAIAEALAVARRKLDETPVLIPLFNNQYLPAEPLEEGNPVFSIQQSELMLWGNSLPAWLEKRFGVPNPYPVPDVPRAIRFWSGFLV